LINEGGPSVIVVDVVVVEVVEVLDVLVVDGCSDVVVDSTASSPGLHAARRRVSATNPAIAVRIEVMLRTGLQLAGIVAADLAR
jgi:hypothetical protein